MSANPLATALTAANDDAWRVYRGRHLSVTFMLAVGATPYLVRIHRGRVEEVETGPFVAPSWTFRLSAARQAWETFWQPLPPPGAHDLMAMIKSGALKLEGDPYPFMANLRYFKELLALPRAHHRGGTA